MRVPAAIERRSVKGILYLNSREIVQREQIVGNIHQKSHSSGKSKEEEMSTRYFALILGIFYVIVGVLGLFPPLLQAIPAGEPNVFVDFLKGSLLGVFPVNILHTLVHLVVGIWGIVAYRSFASSRVFSRAIAVIFGVLFVMGIIPVLRTAFGLIPLYGSDVVLHLVTALLGGYFGWVVPEEGVIVVRH